MCCRTASLASTIVQRVLVKLERIRHGVLVCKINLAKNETLLLEAAFVAERAVTNSGKKRCTDSISKIA